MLQILSFIIQGRYNILAAKAVAKAKSDKSAASAVLDGAVKLDKDKFRLGHTKVFFRAGILGYMEEFREDKIGSVLSWLQSGARGKTSRMEFNVWATERRALLSCQRAIATMLMSKTWPWMQIWLAINPTLRCTHCTKYNQQYETQIETAEKNIGSAIAECKAVTVVYDRLVAEKTELTNVLESGDSAVQDIIDIIDSQDGECLK